MTTKSLVVLVSGRGSNLQAIIDAISSGQLDAKISHVFSNREDAYAITRCKNHKIPCSVIPSKNNDQFFLTLNEQIQMLNPDLIVLAGFMKILPPSFVQNFERKMINIHPSLLPKYKGLHAQKQALEANEPITGCTVHYVDEGCDTGEILNQMSLPILKDDTVETLSARLIKIEHECLIKTLKELL